MGTPGDKRIGFSITGVALVAAGLMTMHPLDGRDTSPAPVAPLVSIAATPASAIPVATMPIATVPIATVPIATMPATMITRPVVIVYGDSLAWEAEDLIVAAFAHRPDVTVITRAFGGTAICDWTAAMRDDAAALQPGAVIVEFSGNAMTPCMLDADGQPLSGIAYLQRYATDAQTVLDTFTPVGSQVFLIGAPPRSDEVSFEHSQIPRLYEALDVIPSVTFVDAGAAVLDDGRWTATLPCLPGEPCTGGVDESGRAVNQVRAPDGLHFCPDGPDAVRGVTEKCTVWSSGAARFAEAMAAPVLDRLPG